MEAALKSIQKKEHPRSNQIIFGKEVNHQIVDWSLGAAMYIMNHQKWIVCLEGNVHNSKKECLKQAP